MVDSILDKCNLINSPRERAYLSLPQQLPAAQGHVDLATDKPSGRRKETLGLMKAVTAQACMASACLASV